LADNVHRERHCRISHTTSRALRLDSVVLGSVEGVGVLVIASSIACSIALRGYVAGAWSSYASGQRAPSGESDVDGDGGGQLQCAEPSLHGRGEIFGVVGVFAAFLRRERVPRSEMASWASSYAISPGVGALFGGPLARASPLSSVNTAMSAVSSPHSIERTCNACISGSLSAAGAVPKRAHPEGHFGM
jgi:hypothetical protein